MSQMVKIGRITPDVALRNVASNYRGSSVRPIGLHNGNIIFDTLVANAIMTTVKAAWFSE